VLTGAHPPVVRATVMVVIACLAMSGGRRALALNTLAAAGLVVLAMNPADLFRTGPQLSFVAVATLGWIGPCVLAWPNDDRLTQLIVAAWPLPRRALRWLGIWVVRSLMVSTALWVML